MFKCNKDEKIKRVICVDGKNVCINKRTENLHVFGKIYLTQSAKAFYLTNNSIVVKINLYSMRVTL